MCCYALCIAYKILHCFNGLGGFVDNFPIQQLNLIQRGLASSPVEPYITQRQHANDDGRTQDGGGREGNLSYSKLDTG